MHEGLSENGKRAALSIAATALPLLVDQLSKSFFLTNHPEKVIMNSGIILGVFSEQESFARIVFLLTSFGFFFFIFALSQIYLFQKSAFTTIFAGFFAGGVTGNAIDRLLRGAAVDFIPVSLPFLQTATMNVADLFQWVGLTGVLWYLYVNHQILWPSVNSRKKLIIDFGYQIRVAAKMMFVSFAASLTIAIFSAAFFFHSVLAKTILSTPEGKKVILSYALCCAAILSLFNLLVFIYGLYISHRAVGPIFAFTKFIEDVCDGKPRPFKLRETDNFKSLETVSKRLLSFYKNNAGRHE